MLDVSYNLYSLEAKCSIGSYFCCVLWIYRVVLCLCLPHKSTQGRLASSSCGPCSIVSPVCLALWDYEEQNKVYLERLLTLGPSLGMTRVPGIGLIYSNISSGVPPMFAHFLTNFPAFHCVLVFVTLQSVMVPKVAPDERFFVGRIGPSEHSIFECVIRNNAVDGIGQRKKVGFQIAGSHKEEVEELIEAKEAGVVYMMGNTYVSASESSPLLKKFAIDVVYSFLRRNCRRPARQLGIPHTLLIEICMAYNV